MIEILLFCILCALVHIAKKLTDNDLLIGLRKISEAYSRGQNVDIVLLSSKTFNAFLKSHETLQRNLNEARDFFKDKMN